MDDWLGTTTFELDLLNQLKKVTDHKGNVVEYTYDSLGNKTVDYKLNNLNQITTSSDDGWKTSPAYTYDQRGNLVQELYSYEFT